MENIIIIIQYFWSIFVILLGDFYEKCNQNHAKKFEPIKKSDYESLPKLNVSIVILRLANGQLLKGNRKVISWNNNNQKFVYEFLGLPFAQSPINERRFRFPQKLDSLLPKNSDEPYDATFHRPSCIQEYDQTFPNFAGSEMWNPPHGISEDCLYFNIWVPVTESQDEILNSFDNLTSITYMQDAFTINNDPKTTMFWIYGGAFNSGSGNLNIYDGTIFSAFENVIVLTANYRVGPFGFLYLNRTQAPGNAGIADSIMAIEWYKQNYLKYFGGSNENMCIFGESAGAMSLHLLLISNKKHLFNRVIFQSSSSYLDQSFRNKYDAYKLSLSFAEKVGCYKRSRNNKQQSSASFIPIVDMNSPLKTIESANDALKLKYNKMNFITNTNSDDFHFDEVNDDSILKCLLNKSASILSQKQFEIDYVNDYLAMQFIPIADFDFNNLKIDDPMNEYIFNINNNKKKYNHEILVGINQNEGTYFTFYKYNNVFFNLSHFYTHDASQSLIRYNNDFVVKRLQESLKTKYPFDSSNFRENKIKNEEYYEKYVKCLSDLYSSKFINDEYNDNTDFNLDSLSNLNKNSPKLAWEKYNKILGDFMFSCPSVKLANKFSEVNPDKTFFYKFNKRQMKNPWPKWTGVMHGYEIPYIFGLPWLDSEGYDETDRYISNKIMSYWANFAKYGKL
jgi:carboxylesterase type B